MRCSKWIGQRAIPVIRALNDRLTTGLVVRSVKSIRYILEHKPKCSVRKDSSLAEEKRELHRNEFWFGLHASSHGSRVIVCNFFD